MPLNAEISPTDNLRYYRFNDHTLISVTSLRRVVGMPFALAQWQVGQVIKGALDLRPGDVFGASDTLTDEDYAKALRLAATYERDTAAALGSSVHEAADAGVPSATLPDIDPRRPFLAQYEDWQRVMGPNIRMSEAQVFHLGEGYAGSLDLVADIAIGTRKPKRFLVDLKTGKGTYTDHAIQLALYMGGQFIGGYDPIEDQDVIFPAQTQLLEDCESMAILHLRPDGWRFIEVPYTDELAAAALDMVHVARFYMNHPTIETLQGVTYP